MKKVIIIMFLVILPVFLFAESIKDLKAYKLMLENQELYKQSYEKADYDKALEYARNVRTYAKEVQAYLDSLNTKPAPEPIVEPEPVSYEKTYEVIRGDSFWNIAAKKEFFGNPFKWPIIYNANKHVLVNPENPDLIHPGMIFHFSIEEAK